MSHPTSAAAGRRKSVVDLRAKQMSGEKLVFATAYDATFGRMMEAGGVDALLIGDSLGMVFQGHDTTLPVTLEEMVYHARAVKRGTREAHLVADMPFMSYQEGPAVALRSAGKLIKEAGVQSVKLEGGEVVASSIETIVRAGIPVIGHVGLTPQSVHAMGGFRVQGRDHGTAERIRHDAQCVEEAGAFALVLEGIPAPLARQIRDERSLPTIGIGAGPDCDGQVLVCHDLLGLSSDFTPKFVRKFANLWEQGLEATKDYCKAVREGSFPTAAHSFGTRPSGSAASQHATSTGSASSPPKLTVKRSG